MTKENRVSFAMSKIEFLKAVEDEKFATVNLYAFKTGKNSHMITSDIKTLKTYAKTILEVPLVCYFDKRTGDLGGHDPREMSVGYIPANAKIHFEKDEADGEYWLIVEARIWKRYSGAVLDLFKKSMHKKPVSVELIVTQSDKSQQETIIKQFAFFAVTILGSLIAPSVAGANAEIIKYSEEEYIKDKEEDLIRKESLKKEEGNNMEMKEYLEKFNMSYSEMRDMIGMACSENKYNREGSENMYPKYYMVDFCQSYVYAEDALEGKYKAIPYNIEENKCSINFEDVKGAKRAWMVEEKSMLEFTDESVLSMAKSIISKESEIEFEKIADTKLVFEDDVEKIDPEVVVGLEKEVAETKENFEKSEEANKAMMITNEQFEKNILELNSDISEAKEQLVTANDSITSLTAEKVELENFKKEAEIKDEASAKAERLAKISHTTKAMQDKGSKMPENEINDWVDKATNFADREDLAQYADIEIWEKDFKAATVEYLTVEDKKSEPHKRWGLPSTDETTNLSSSGRWKNIKNKKGV